VISKVYDSYYNYFKKIDRTNRNMLDHTYNEYINLYVHILIYKITHTLIRKITCARIKAKI